MALQVVVDPKQIAKMNSLMDLSSLKAQAKEMIEFQITSSLEDFEEENDRRMQDTVNKIGYLLL